MEKIFTAINESSNQGFDGNFLFASFFTAAASIISRKFPNVKINDNWTEPTVLHTCLMSPKSQEIEKILKTLEGIEWDLNEKFKIAYENYKLDEDFIDPPTPESVFLNTPSIDEIYRNVTDQNPSLLIYINDLVNIFDYIFKNNIYGQKIYRHLMVWDGSSLKITMKNQLPNFILHPRISVIGLGSKNLIIKQIRNEKLVNNIGLWKFSFVPQEGGKNPISKIEGGENSLNYLLEFLKDMFYILKEIKNPTTLTYNSNSRKLMEEKDKLILFRYNQSNNDFEKTLYWKYRRLLHRYSLIIQVLKNIDTGKFNEDISEESLQYAFKIIKTFKNWEFKIFNLKN